MVKLCTVIAISTTILLHQASADDSGCSALPIPHFQWLNPDGTLVNPRDLYYFKTLKSFEETHDCCGTLCSDKWKPINESPGCKFCPSNETLVCQGTAIYNVSNPDAVPTKLSLYKLFGVGLDSLPPKSFKGLSIQNLIIENSNLSHLALDTFNGVKSIESLHIKNAKLHIIHQADYLFQNIIDLKFLSLEDSGLKVLSSASFLSAHLHNLTYFSLAGNTVHTMDVYFLQNSSLTFLDLRNVTVKLKNMDIEGSGLSKLPSSLETIDLSKAKISHRVIEKLMEQVKMKNITTINLGNLRSKFQSFSALRHVKNSLQYLSFQGTDLDYVFNHDFKSVEFTKMKELNLENCNISQFRSGIIQRHFPNLSVISLARNSFFILDLNFLFYLPKLIYIDLSKAFILDVVCGKVNREIKNIQGVDLSHTELAFEKEKSELFFTTLKNLQVLSLCMSSLSEDAASELNNLNHLNYLDLSAALSTSALEYVFIDMILKNNMTLTELNFGKNNFKFTGQNPSYFSQLAVLEKLDISDNLLRELSGDMFPPTLKTLNASQNLITTWYFSLLKNNSKLQYLDVSNNQITYVSEAMVDDFYKLDSLGLDNNPLICHNKVVALVCSNIKNITAININETQSISKAISDTTGTTRNKSHSLTLVDWRYYKCYDLLFNEFRQFSQEKDCNQYYEEVSTIRLPQNPTTQNYHPKTTTATAPPSTRKSAWDWERTYVVLGPILVLIIVAIVLGRIIYVKWWNLRCFLHRYISLKKTHLLKKSGDLPSKPEIYYDLFVSYSDVDRTWVLDHLIPNMEADGDVSLCIHERDFQVGMSILENIINCMDRSHSLLLVVSSAFIYSKWCQFEMHLAQHRMVETFRDQLVLVLLEDIPRKARSQTLHHLMMTKTYLMWPQTPSKDDAYELFWRRLKRALKPNTNYWFTV